MGRPILRTESGLTLLELLVVILIAAALVGVGLVSTQNMRQGYQLRTASRRVFADMQKVRLKAIKEGKTGSFTFDEANDTYTYGFPGETAMEIDLAGDFGVTIYNATDFNFNGNGTAGSGGVYIRLLNRCQRIYVASPGTGNVKISDEACP